MNIISYYCVFYEQATCSAFTFSTSRFSSREENYFNDELYRAYMLNNVLFGYNCYCCIATYCNLIMVLCNHHVTNNLPEHQLQLSPFNHRLVWSLWYLLVTHWHDMINFGKQRLPVHISGVNLYGLVCNLLGNSTCLSLSNGWPQERQPCYASVIQKCYFSTCVSDMLYGFEGAC